MYNIKNLKKKLNRGHPNEGHVDLFQMCATVLEKTGSVTTLSRYGHKDRNALIHAAAKCKSSGESDL